MSHKPARNEIRIKRGRKITTLAELRDFQKNIVGDRLLIGSASNFEVVRKDSVLYSDADFYGREPLFLPFEGMAAVNLAIGGMGRGKTSFLNNIINARPDSNMVIHCPKGEYNVSFYDADKDMIVAYPDSGSVIWDIFAEIAKDRQVGEMIWRNMLLSIRGEKATEGGEWDTYAIPWLMKLSAGIIDSQIALEDIPMEIIRLYKEFKAETTGTQSGMQGDALGTAAPIFNVLFQMYHVGVEDNRRFVTVEDMTKARRVFLCNNTKFAAQLDIVNNALLACLINTYLSRPNIGRSETDRYSYFILDEFLTFKLDEKSEEKLLTLCRSKGISVWLGMQHFPDDKKRLTRLTASRYVTAVFKLDDAYTIEEVQKMADDIEYQRKEATFSLGDSGSMISLSGGVSLNETLVDVKTKQIPSEVLADISPYVAYIEINDLSGRHRTFCKPLLLKTLKNPVRISVEDGEEGFLYSAIARNAPRLEEFV